LGFGNNYSKGLKVKVEKHEGSHERRILVGMVVDKSVLGRLAQHWGDEMFASKWANLVGNWCVKYFERYGKPPGKHIQSAFERWASSHKDEATVKLVERFLQQCSEEYESAEDINADHLVDIAAEYFNRVRYAKLADNIQASLDSGELPHDLVAKFGKLEIGQGSAVDLLHDELAFQAAFADKKEPLIVYPGALGQFFGDTFERDSFVSFMGPEKRGKSWWLQDVACTGIEQRRKVAFFAVGDMSQNQMIRRFAIRWAKRPLKPTKPERPIKWPKSIDHNPDDPVATVEHEELVFKKALTWQRAWKAVEDLTKNKLKTNEILLRLSCHANNTIGTAGIQAALQQWERLDWTPDLIVIDYADLLSPTPGYSESRDQINATWKNLRSLSQSLHCCVVTATQSDAASYSKDILDKGNFSDDKRKMAHVTAMIGINQKSDEKPQGLQRLNYVVLREDEFVEGQCVHVAGCLGLARPAIRSIF
jgi:hypothetical protein